MNQEVLKIKDLVNVLSIKTNIKISDNQNIIYNGNILKLLEEEALLDFEVGEVLFNDKHDITIKI